MTCGTGSRPTTCSPWRPSSRASPRRPRRWLRGVFDHVVAAGLLEPGTFPVAPDLVEALALQGRHDEALEVIAWLEQVSADQDHPWGRAMSERSRRARRAARRLGPTAGRVGPDHGGGRRADDPGTAARRGAGPPRHRLGPAPPAAVGPGPGPSRERGGTLRGARRGRLVGHRPRGAESGRRPPSRRRGRTDTHGAGGGPARGRGPGQQDDRPTAERVDRHRRDAPDPGVRQARGALAGPARHPPAGAVCRAAAAA